MEGTFVLNVFLSCFPLKSLLEKILPKDESIFVLDSAYVLKVICVGLRIQAVCCLITYLHFISSSFPLLQTEMLEDSCSTTLQRSNSRRVSLIKSRV